MKRRKLFAMLLSAALLVPTLTGCSNSAGGSTEAGGGSVKESESASKEEVASDESEAVTISVAEWPTSADPDKLALYEGYVETMKELYPNITVVPVEYAYSVDTFLPKAVSGQLPTVYSTYFTETSKIIGAGYAKDITAVLEDVGYDKMLNKELLDLVTSDGKIYGIPGSSYNVGMLYNIELFKEAGLLDENGVPQYAQTYEDLAKLAVTVKEKTGKPGAIRN